MQQGSILGPQLFSLYVNSLLLMCDVETLYTHDTKREVAFLLKWTIQRRIKTINTSHTHQKHQRDDLYNTTGKKYLCAIFIGQLKSIFWFTHWIQQFNFWQFNLAYFQHMGEYGCTFGQITDLCDIWPPWWGTSEEIIEIWSKASVLLRKWYFCIISEMEINSCFSCMSPQYSTLIEKAESSSLKVSLSCFFNKRCIL